MSDKKYAYASRTFKEDIYAWGLLILLALVFLWGTGEYGKVDPVEFDSWKGPVSNQATLTILEFDRVVRKENADHIHQDRLRKQLKALDEDGFEAVSVEDVFNFYYQDGKLPEKSVLLIFANGYLETYSVVDPVLRQMKWPATVSLITGLVDKRETFFLYWDRLRRMVDSGIWGIISGGHRSREWVTNAENQRVGRFLTHKDWIESEGRQETDREFSARILRDYKVSRNLIEEKIPGTRVLAYSPLFGDFQNQIKKASLTEPHARALKQFFHLGFVDSFVGVNDKRSDPFRLRRLRVQPGWQPETLRAFLNKAIQATAVLEPDATQEDSIWFTGKGELLETSGQSNILTGKELRSVRNQSVEPETHLRGTPGTAIYKPGRHGAENWTLKANIRLDRGEFWIGQHSPEYGDEWRLGGNANNLNVQYRIANGQYENLSSSRAGIDPGVWHDLRLIKRGRAVIVKWDGQALWNLPVNLQGEFNGDIALQVWSGEGEGSMGLSDAKVAFIPDNIRWLKSYPGENDVQLLIRYAQKVSGVTAVTHAVQGDRLHSVSFDEDLFQIISRRYGWNFIPTVRLLPEINSSIESINESGETNEFGGTVAHWMSALLILVKNNHWTHVHLDFSQRDTEVKPEGFSSFSAFRVELEKMGCHLLITTEGRPPVDQPINSRQILLDPIFASIGRDDF